MAHKKNMIVPDPFCSYGIGCPVVLKMIVETTQALLSNERVRVWDLRHLGF